MVSRAFAPHGNGHAHTKGASRGIRRLALVAVMAVLAAALSTNAARAAAPLRLVYRVSHAVIGDLGSYTYTVEPLGNGAAEILSREHIDVRMLGIPMFHEDAMRTERWQGSRLMAFHGITDNGGSRVEVKGEAEGDRFVISSPQGILTAAATVHPADPCAANFLASTTVMRPDTGAVEKVSVSGGEPGSLDIDGEPVPVRKYVVDGKTRYTVWLNARNLPVKFVVDDDAGQATFTLARCVSCGAPVARLGMR